MPRIDRATLALVPVAVLGTAASAWASAANFTTLNSSQMTLLSFGETALTPNGSATYAGGPSNDLPYWSGLQSVSDGVTVFGTAEWGLEGFGATLDQLGFQWIVSGPSSAFHLEVTLNVTLSSRVEVRSIALPAPEFGTITYTPTGGSASALSVGTQLAAGTYDIVWNFDETTPRSGANQTFLFESIANPVPGAGVAAIAACGMGGVLRRRRR